MKKLVLLLLALAIAACEPAPTSYQPEPFAFESLPPIMVNVHEIRVVDGYRSPMRKPNVEQDFPVSPSSATKLWIARRLTANPAISANSILEITIEDASVKEVPLPKTEGVKGLFTDDQDARYDARLSVSMRLYTGARGMSDAAATVVITRSRSINEKATIIDREKMFHRMTQDMMATFDAEAQKRLHQYFASVVR